MIHRTHDVHTRIKQFAGAAWGRGQCRVGHREFGGGRLVEVVGSAVEFLHAEVVGGRDLPDGVGVASAEVDDRALAVYDVRDEGLDQSVVATLED